MTERVPEHPDYKAWVAQTRATSTTWSDTWALNLADAVEALLAERDELQAQINAMTVEWADAEAGRPDLIAHGAEGEGRVRERVRDWNRMPRVMRGEIAPSAVFRRLAGPWVEVKEEGK